MSKTNELGTLVVVVLKARNLNDKHSFYKQDVFAQVSLNGVVKRTQVDIKGGQHPIWDEEIRFPVMRDTSSKYRELEVACFAKEPRSDDILGKGVVDIADTLKTGEFDEWVSLGIDGVLRGDLYLEMTYYANAPGPVSSTNPAASSNIGLLRRPSKLPPSDRLYRPSHPSAPPTSISSHRDFRYQGLGHNLDAVSSDGKQLLSPSSSSRSSSAASVKRSESPLPPLPEETLPPVSLPTMLVPGGSGVKSKPQEIYGTPTVPSILRPGSGKPSSAAVAHHNYDTTHAPRLPSHEESNTHPSLSTFGQNTVSPQKTHDTPVPMGPYHQPTSVTSQAWPTSPSQSEILSFPVPTIAPTQERVNYLPSTTVPTQRSSIPQHSADNGLPDPYLQVRYATPLPLPPDSMTQPPDRQPLPQYDRLASRTEALRLAEEDAVRRKEQENKDFELALQLDRELNL